jgi:hypothetical protein
MKYPGYLGQFQVLNDSSNNPAFHFHFHGEGACKNNFFIMSVPTTDKSSSLADVRF